MRRCVGLDVHRDFAQVAIWDKGRVFEAGRVPTSPEGLREFAKGLRRSDRVALEATMNTAAIAAVLAAGRSGDGVEPVQDAGDRGVKDQDRQGRRSGAR